MSDQVTYSYCSAAEHALLDFTVDLLNHISTVLQLMEAVMKIIKSNQFWSGLLIIIFVLLRYHYYVCQISTLSQQQKNWKNCPTYSPHNANSIIDKHDNLLNRIKVNPRLSVSLIARAGTYVPLIAFLSIIVTFFSIGIVRVMYFSLFSPKQLNCFQILLLTLSW